MRLLKRIFMVSLLAAHSAFLADTGAAPGETFALLRRTLPGNLKSVAKEFRPTQDLLLLGVD